MNNGTDYQNLLDILREENSGAIVKELPTPAKLCTQCGFYTTAIVRYAGIPTHLPVCSHPKNIAGISVITGMSIPLYLLSTFRAKVCSVAGFLYITRAAMENEKSEAYNKQQQVAASSKQRKGVSIDDLI